MADASPTKIGMNKSLQRAQTKKMSKIGKSPSKKGGDGDTKENKESGLASPTSVTM